MQHFCDSIILFLIALESQKKGNAANICPQRRFALIAREKRERKISTIDHHSNRALDTWRTFLEEFVFFSFMFLQINRDDHHTYLLRLLGRHSVLLSSVWNRERCMGYKIVGGESWVYILVNPAIRVKKQMRKRKRERENERFTKRINFD